MASKVPLLSAKKWARIVDDLPPNWRDPVLISAVLFATTSGSSLRDTAAWFGCSRARLMKCSRELEGSGALDAILAALRLHRVAALARPFWRHLPIAGEVIGIKLADFRRAVGR